MLLEFRLESYFKRNDKFTLYNLFNTINPSNLELPIRHI